MVCILVYLNYFYCKDIPFIVKRKENIGIFTLSLQYSNFEIPIKMEIDLTTPALLFSAISLIMLAYTNRFLSYAQLVRTLKDQYRENHSAVTAAQIANLRKRLYLTRAMQVTGIGSLLLCVVSMFLMYIQFYLISVYIFGLALVLLIISLGKVPTYDPTAPRYMTICTNALEIASKNPLKHLFLNACPLGFSL